MANDRHLESLNGSQLMNALPLGPAYNLKGFHWKQSLNSLKDAKWNKPSGEKL